MLSFFRARNSGGRHAARQAPAAPSPVVPAPRPPVALGGGARLTASIPAAIIELTDTHAHLLAGILLNAGDEFRNAAGAPEDAAEAYVRHLEGEVGRLKAQPRWRFAVPSPELAEQVADLYGNPLTGVELKTGGPAIPPQARREQIAAYRHATDPDAAGQNCPACLHLWTLHDADGCDAKVYPAHSLNGEPCPCEHTPPAAEEKM